MMVTNSATANVITSVPLWVTSAVAWRSASRVFISSLSIVAIDKESGETFVVDQTADFVADVLGSVATPYVVNISPSTGIGNLDADGRSSDDIYNMLGQKVERMGHTGIYVVGGKKRVISKFNAQKYAK